MSHPPIRTLPALGATSGPARQLSFTTRSGAHSGNGGKRDGTLVPGIEVGEDCLQGPRPTDSWWAQIRNQPVNHALSGVYFCRPNGSVNMSQINYPLCKKGSSSALHGGCREAIRTVAHEHRQPGNVCHPLPSPSPQNLRGTEGKGPVPWAVEP